MRANSASSLVGRVVAASSVAVLGFGASQMIRLASNLILTRLLFPEAFGIMAIMNVYLIGLVMLSDIGTSPAIAQSQRGDEPNFLDTVWTFQIARGILLYGLALALAPLLAQLYSEPRLRILFPVFALSLLIGAFRPTRLETANRHLSLARVTILDLSAQAVGISVGIALAWVYRSVWALVLLNLMVPLVHLVLLSTLLPGRRNRLSWDRAAAFELIHFGKFIFLSTLCGFFSEQADKFILAYYLNFEVFGIYNMAYFLASIPLLLGGVLRGRLLIPVYRESPPAASSSNGARVRKIRAGVLSILLVISGVLAVGGDWLVRFLYDPRYYDAAGMVVLFAVCQVPALLILSCDMALLALGASRHFFWLSLWRAVLVTSGLILGLYAAGLLGAIVGQALGNLAAYLILARFLAPHAAWDPSLDGRFLFAAVALGGLALWIKQESLAAIS